MTGRFSLPLYLHFLPKYSIPSNVKPLTLPVARFGSIDHLVCSSNACKSFYAPRCTP